jgi:hypothetical protein
MEDEARAGQFPDKGELCAERPERRGCRSCNQFGLTSVLVNLLLVLASYRRGYSPFRQQILLHRVPRYEFR